MCRKKWEAKDEKHRWWGLSRQNYTDQKLSKLHMKEIFWSHLVIEQLVTCH